MENVGELSNFNLTSNYPAWVDEVNIHGSFCFVLFCFVSYARTLGQRLTVSSVSILVTKEIDREIKTLDDLKKGDIVRGYVKNCSNVGVFVRYDMTMWLF